jgi:hypothetical protein
MWVGEFSPGLIRPYHRLLDALIDTARMNSRVRESYPAAPEGGPGRARTA